MVAAMSKLVEGILTPKPVARPRNHAYSIVNNAHAGQCRIGGMA